jgi:hypothetical protein
MAFNGRAAIANGMAFNGRAAAANGVRRVARRAADACGEGSGTGVWLGNGVKRR